MGFVTSEMAQLAWRHLYLSGVLDTQPTVVQFVQQRGQWLLLTWYRNPFRSYFLPTAREGNVFTGFVSHSVHNLPMVTRSLLILVTVGSERILRECFPLKILFTFIKIKKNIVQLREWGSHDRHAWIRRKCSPGSLKSRVHPGCWGESFLVNSIDLCYEIKGYLTPLFNARILFFSLVRRLN